MLSRTEFSGHLTGRHQFSATFVITMFILEPDSELAGM